MIFSSKTPSDLTSHAAAHLCSRCEAQFQEDGLYSEDEHRDYHQPPQHNETNPILTWFRAVIEDPKCGEFDQVVDDFLIYHIKGHGKQEHHARRVLARLANLAQGQ